MGLRKKSVYRKLQKYKKNYKKYKKNYRRGNQDFLVKIGGKPYKGKGCL